MTRAADILELFLEHEGPLSAPEIARRVGLPRTTVHELIHTLVDRSLLAVASDGDRQFTLGPTVLSLGYRYQMGLDVAREGQLVAQRIAAQCGETVHVATLAWDEVLYVAKVDTSKTVRMVSTVGGRLPAHVTAVGKVLLAFLSAEELDARLPLDQPLRALTSNSITDGDQLRKVLDEVRATGIAREIRESNQDVGCVAAPVRDHTGTVKAAMSISAPMERHTPGLLREWEATVSQGASELSERLGWRPRA